MPRSSICNEVKVKSLSHVRLFANPWTVAYQAPPSMGFSRQKYWSGLPFLSPNMKVKSESEVAQSCPTLRDPMDYSPPGSSVHGILQTRALEWVAIAFSGHTWQISLYVKFLTVTPAQWQNRSLDPCLHREVNLTIPGPTAFARNLKAIKRLQHPR